MTDNTTRKYKINNLEELLDAAEEMEAFLLLALEDKNPNYDLNRSWQRAHLLVSDLVAATRQEI